MIAPCGSWMIENTANWLEPPPAGSTAMITWLVFAEESP